MKLPKSHLENMALRHLAMEDLMAQSDAQLRQEAAEDGARKKRVKPMVNSPPPISSAHMSPGMSDRASSRRMRRKLVRV